MAIERFDTGLNGAPQPFENRIGHQGLFFDRFDGGVNNVQMPQLSVDAATGLAAKGLYQNRNRSYSPALGRFVQRDPYGTAIEAISEARQLGQVSRSRGPAVNTTLFASAGLNRYAYCRANPSTRGDALGLFDMSLGGLLFSSTTSAELRMEWTEDIGQFGIGLSETLGGMFDAASFDQVLDAEWAMDWSQPDDFYSSSSAYSDGTGSWAGWFDSTMRKNTAPKGRRLRPRSPVLGEGRPGKQRMEGCIGSSTPRQTKRTT